MTTPAPPHVLVLDPSPEAVSAVGGALVVAGYRVTGTGRLLDDARAVRALAPDAIVLGYPWPGEDGMRAVRTLRLDAELARVPLVVLAWSAVGGPEVRDELAGMGVAVLVGPFAVGDVLAAVADAVHPGGRV